MALGCGELDDSAPILFFLPATLAGGVEVVDTLVPSNPEVYEPALRLWCEVGVAVQAGGGTLGDDGQASVALLIGNGSPHDLEVVMPALESGGASWKELATTVPAGEQVTEIVEGRGVDSDADQAVPWADGRILVNGNPWRMAVAGVWC